MARKVKRILFSEDYFNSGAVRWAAGKHYPVSEDTQRQIAVGIAREISVDADEAAEVDGQLELGAAGDSSPNAEPPTAADAQAGVQAETAQPPTDAWQ